LNSEIAYKDAQLSLLISEKDDLQSQVNSLNSEKGALQNQNSDLTGQINNLTEIIKMDKPEFWIDDHFENVAAGSYV
jgi:peptidoglycan hydrolase CwlO-like protein